MTLLYDAQQFTIYVGIFLLITGIIGNGINLLVFLKARTYRRTPCTFYFLISSIVNLFYILLNLTTRILSVSYGIDSTTTSDIWCKIRQFFLVTPSLLSMTLSCLAAIDQFLVTSRSVYLRNCSQIQWAYRISITAIISCCLHGIPVLLFYQISLPAKMCVNINAGFAIYILFYLLGIMCAIPISIMILCGWLTYRNIHQAIRLTELKADRQLIRMTLTHVILAVISLLPYGIYQSYSVLTKTVNKDYDRQSKEYFAGTILSMLTYLYYIGSCYTFLISSKRFREKVKDQLFWWRHRNQINSY